MVHMLMREEEFLKGCMHKYRGFTHSWQGRRPRYRLGARVNLICSGNVYSETIPINVITYWAVSEGVTLEGVKDPRGTLAYMPRASLGLGVDSHPSVD
jgi:hypothetical protein